jgi:hypothetical protein
VVSGPSDAVADSSGDPAGDGVPLKKLAQENINRILKSTD